MTTRAADLMDQPAAQLKQTSSANNNENSESNASSSSSSESSTETTTNNTSIIQQLNENPNLASTQTRPGDSFQLQADRQQETCTDPNCSFWRRVALLSANAPPTACDSGPTAACCLQWCTDDQPDACCAPSVDLTPPPPPAATGQSPSPPTFLVLSSASAGASCSVTPGGCSSQSPLLTAPARLSFARRNSSSIGQASPPTSSDLCRSPSGGGGRPLILAPFRQQFASLQPSPGPARDSQVGRSPSVASELAAAGTKRRTSSAFCYDNSSSAASSRKSSIITFAKQHSSVPEASNELSGKRDLSTSCLSGVGWQPISGGQQLPRSGDHQSASFVADHDESATPTGGKANRRRQLKRRRPLKCIRSSSDNQLSQSCEQHLTAADDDDDDRQPPTDLATKSEAASAASGGPDAAERRQPQGGVAISVTDASGSMRRRRSSTESIPSASSQSSVNNSGAESDKENSTDDDSAEVRIGPAFARSALQCQNQQPQQQQQQQFDGRPTRFYSVKERPQQQQQQQLFARPAFLQQHHSINQQININLNLNQKASQAGSPTGSAHSCSSRHRLGSHSPSRFNFGG